METERKERRKKKREGGEKEGGEEKGKMNERITFARDFLFSLP